MPEFPEEVRCVAIEGPPEVMEEVRAAVIWGYVRLAHGGLEVGGLLLGRMDGGTLHIAAIWWGWRSCWSRPLASQGWKALCHSGGTIPTLAAAWSCRIVTLRFTIAGFPKLGK
jgi:hypothetical protein